MIIYDSGEVFAVVKGRGQKKKKIGQIELATFSNPKGLRRVDENLYSETEESDRAIIHNPGLDGTGVLKTGYLECSKERLPFLAFR
jgi:flagellar basal-body rod protein FlgG